MTKLLEFFGKSEVQDVQLAVLSKHKMEAEFAYIDPHPESSRRGRDVCRDFWTCLMFRPDVAGTVLEELRRQNSKLAAILQEAINAAGLPEHFW